MGSGWRSSAEAENASAPMYLALCFVAVSIRLQDGENE